MAFVHGKNLAVMVDQYDLTAYFNQVNAGRSCQVVNTTVFGLDNKTYIAGIEEGSVSVQGLWDGAASAVDSVLDSALGTEDIITVVIGGQTLGNRCVMLKSENTDYQVRATVTDAVRLTMNAVADGGVRTAGRLLHILEAETTTENGTSVDDTASSSFGGVGHLHVTAFSGTNGVVKIQHSTNDSVWNDLITFSTITGVTSERTAVSGTVNRYLRYAITTDNFTSMTLAVAFARNRS